MGLYKVQVKNIFSYSAFILFGLSLSSTPLANQTPCLSHYTYDDWVCAPQSGTLCNGYYKETVPPFPNQSQEFLEKQPISITGDQGEFTPNGNTIMKGHVHLIQGNRQLFANSATIHRDPSKPQSIDYVTALGNVKITEPGFRLDGRKAEVFVEENREVISDAHYRIYNRHARGEASRITVQDPKLSLENASYTTCNPFQNTWELKAKRVTLNKETGRGTARHARLYFKDIPILYLPYVNFPIDDRRQTGFLYPTFGNTSNSGIDFSLPFYWNLAPNYDATLTPRVLTKRGFELQGQFRYLSAHSQGSFEAGFLPGDRAYRDFRREKLANPSPLQNNDPRVIALQKANNNRSAFRADHITRFNDNLSTNIIYNTVHDDNYFMDLGTNLGMSSTTQLLQQGDLLFQSNHLDMQARLQQYQTLHPFKGPETPDVYRRLPQIALQNSFADLPLGFEWTTLGEFSHFLHKHEPFTGNAFTTGNRFWVRPGLSYPMMAPGWYIKPRIQLNIVSYSLQLSPRDIQQQYPKSSHQTLPMLDLDSGLIFERPLQVLGCPYTQTLEPRAYYLYVPYRNQNTLPNFDTTYAGFDFNQLYRDNRFTGLDRLGDANQLTLGLTSRFLNTLDTQERLNLTLGQIFYFRENQVTVCSQNNPNCIAQDTSNRKRHYSSWVGLARYHLQDAWTASAGLEWDPKEKRTDKTTLSLQYRPEELSVVNVGYQYLRRNPVRINPKTGVPERLSQTDTSFAWAVTEHWRLLGRWHYDLRNRRSNDVSFGIEQQGCCTAVRLFVTRYLTPYDDKLAPLGKRYSNAIYLQVVFKGFAGVGHKIGPALKRAIPDYHWRDNEF